MKTTENKANKTIFKMFWKVAILLLIILPRPAFSFVAYFFSPHKGDNSQNADQQKDPSQAMDVENVYVEELNSRLQVGGNYTYLTLQPHGHQSFEGSLGGAQASYEYRPSNRFYGGATFAWKEGSTHGSAGRRSILYFDAQERLGYTFATAKKDWRLTLFSGLGFRFVRQNLHPNEGSSLRFRYNEFYVPVGLLTNYEIHSCCALGVDFTWMPQIYPTVSIVPLKGAHWTLIDTLNNFYVAVPLTFTLTKNKKFLLIFKPSYEHWEDGHSTAKLSGGASLGLPGNTYNYYGADLNFAYSF